MGELAIGADCEAMAASLALSGSPALAEPHEAAREHAERLFLTAIGAGTAAEVALIGWLLALPAGIDPAQAADQLRQRVLAPVPSNDAPAGRQDVVAMLEAVQAWPAERLQRLGAGTKMRI